MVNDQAVIRHLLHILKDEILGASMTNTVASMVEKLEVVPLVLHAPLRHGLSLIHI